MQACRVSHSSEIQSHGIAMSVRGRVKQQATPLKPIPPQAEFIGRQQAAALVGVNIQTIDKWLNTGQLSRYKPVRRVLIRRTELVKLVEGAKL
jgi:excisionase family DNA binding protein